MARTYFPAGKYFQKDITAGSLIGSYPFSLSIWFRTLKIGTFTWPIFYLGDKDALNAKFASIQVSLGGGAAKALMVTRNDSGGANTITSSDDWANQWNHVVGVWRSGTDRELYLNGEPNGTNSDSIALDVLSFDRIDIGGLGDSTPVHTWVGGLAEAQIFDIGLTDEKVSAMYDGRQPFHINPPVGYWPMYGKDSGDLQDYSGNLNTLTETGGTLNSSFWGHPNVNPLGLWFPPYSYSPFEGGGRRPVRRVAAIKNRKRRRPC